MHFQKTTAYHITRGWGAQIKLSKRQLNALQHLFTVIKRKTKGLVIKRLSEGDASFICCKNFQHYFYLTVKKKKKVTGLIKFRQL